MLYDQQLGGDHVRIRIRELLDMGYATRRRKGISRSERANTNWMASHRHLFESARGRQTRRHVGFETSSLLNAHLRVSIRLLPWLIACTILCTVSSPEALTARPWPKDSALAFALEQVAETTFSKLDDVTSSLRTNGRPEFERPSCDGIILRLWFEGSTSLRGIGYGESLREAINGAIDNLVTRSTLALAANRMRPCKASLEVFRIPTSQWQHPDNASISLGEGLAFDLGPKRSLMLITPLDILALALYEDGEIDMTRLRARFKPILAAPAHVRSYVPGKKGNAIRLYSGGHLPARIDVPTIMQAIERTARHLCRGQADDGRFTYIYNARDGTGQDAYNIVRHAGVVWALSRYARSFQRHRIQIRATKGAQYLMRHIKRLPDTPEVALIAPESSSVLGATSLTLLALLEIPRTAKNRERLSRSTTALGKGILWLQRPSGAFHYTVESKKSSAPLKRHLPFFPGEALLALTELSTHDPAPQWRKAALRAAHQQVTLFIKKGQTCHWSIQGIARLGELEDSPVLDRAAYKMALAMSRNQQNEDCLLQAGSWHSSLGPTACSAACRLEAFGPALEAAERRDEDTRQLETIVLRATSFILSQQITPTNALFTRDPAKAIGGFRSTAGDLTIRMDVNQHAIAALLETAALLRRKPYLANGQGCS